MKSELSSTWKSSISHIPWRVVIILGVSLGITGLVVGAKSLGWWEMGELAAYDQSVRWKSLVEPDPR